jgi:hypothetical protein
LLTCSPSNNKGTSCNNAKIELKILVVDGQHEENPSHHVQSITTRNQTDHVLVAEGVVHNNMDGQRMF